jgi:hypothetical protein
MARLNRRRVPITRRFHRLGRPSLPTPPSAPDAKAPPEPAPAASSSSSTASLPSVGQNSDPNAETEVAFSVQADLPPQPPKKLEFTCPCGTVLVATPATYDKHSRCAMCQTVMLLNLVYDAEHRTHEIVPFRISPDPSH